MRLNHKQNKLNASDTNTFSGNIMRRATAELSGDNRKVGWHHEIKRDQTR